MSRKPTKENSLFVGINTRSISLKILQEIFWRLLFANKKKSCKIYSQSTFLSANPIKYSSHDSP